jgi:hypothetical protein
MLFGTCFQEFGSNNEKDRTTNESHCITET